MMMYALLMAALELIAQEVIAISQFGKHEKYIWMHVDEMRSIQHRSLP